MQNGIHFISGLPRSGSTLLSALLLQNPALHAGITSPVGSLVGALLKDMSQPNETSILIDDAHREAVLRGVFDNYYFDIHPTRTVFDTNRGWTARLDLLAALFPSCRIICCVRHIPWVLDSLERLVRQNKFELSRIYTPESLSTAFSRTEGLMASNGLVGFALNALKQAMHGEQAPRVLLVPYELLTADPGQTLAAVYKFCELPSFEHDFDSIVFDSAEEFDRRLGAPGLHTVHPRVRQTQRQTVLPPELWTRYERASFWQTQPGI